MQQWKWVLWSLGTVALLVFWLVRIEPEAGGVRWTISLLLPCLISGYGLKKRSLESSGAALAVVVGFLLTAASACFSSCLIVFFITSSRLTKWKATEKQRLEEGYKEGNVDTRHLVVKNWPSLFLAGGQRNWVQVVCNGGVASVGALFYLSMVGMKECPLRYLPGGMLDTPSQLSLAILAALSCSCGDTWASEVGSVIGGKPRLITSWKPVPRGTNGGVTTVGLACSIAGGALLGLTHFLTLLVFWNDRGLPTEVSRVAQLELVWVGAIAGLVGSLLDSLLGATLQFSGFSGMLDCVVNSPGPGVTHVSGRDILDNHTVNFLSSLLTALFVPLLWTAKAVVLAHLSQN